MKKSSPSRRPTSTKELEPFAPLKVNFAKFSPDLSPSQLAGLFPEKLGIHSPPELFIRTIDTLSVKRTVGQGRTNLTFIEPTIVQADAATPFAGFDRTVSRHRDPAIQMHFEPGAYGISAVSSYVMVFTIETAGPCTFSLGGSPGKITNPGSRAVNGRTTVTLAFRNVAPTDNIFGFLQQTAGGNWNFFSVAAQFPPLLIQA